MKQRLYVWGIVVAAAASASASYFFAVTGHAWLMAVTGCAVMLLVICGVGLALCLKDTRREKTDLPYRRKAQYVTPAEKEFLYLLRSLLGNRYEVCVQAPLVSVIEKTSGAFRNELFRVADYLIADAATFAPLLLVELNDASHARADRRERDRKVAEICAAAQMPLVSFTPEQARNPQEVKKTIFKLLR